MRFFLYHIFIFGLSFLQLVTPLDVSWIPSDPDGPLPLSVKYRDSLRKLCTLLDSGSTLPSEIQDKRSILIKMCKKLRSGDNNIASAADFTTLTSFKKVLITGVLGIGGSLILWDKRRQIGRTITTILKRITGSDKREVLQNLIDVQVARDARLKRFRQVDDLDSIVQLAETN